MSDQNPPYEVALKVAALLRALEQSPGAAARVNDLAETLEVSRRTVIRYANALEYGALFLKGKRPVEVPAVRRDWDKTTGATWLFLENRERTLPANIFRFAAVHAALETLAAGGGSLLSEMTADVLDEVEGALPPAHTDLVERARTAFHYVPFGPKRYRDDVDLIEGLVGAVLYRRPVEFDYRDRHGRGFHTRMEPFTVVLYRDGLYVLGRVPDRRPPGQWRLFAIDRIAGIEVDRQQTFEVPADFDPAEHFGDSLGLWPTEDPAEDVEIAFAPEVAVDIRERTWPGDYTLVGGEDGRPVLRMSVQVTPEVVAWILSWGRSVEVLAPDSLQREIVSHLRDATARYEDIPQDMNKTVPSGDRRSARKRKRA